MRRPLDLLIPALAACGVIVALDQGTKALATSLVTRGDRVEVLPFLAFENVRETMTCGCRNASPSAFSFAKST